MKQIAFLLILTFSIKSVLAQQPELKVNLGHSDNVRTVQYFPNGKYIVSGSDDKTIKIWDVVSGKELKTLIGHSNTVTCICVTANNKLIVSCGLDTVLKVWDVATGKELKTLYGSKDAVGCCDISKDGRFVVGGSGDNTNTINLWDITTGKRIKSFEGHYSNYVYFSPDGKNVASCENQVIRIWDIATGKEIKKLLGNGSLINAIHYSPDGKYIVSGNADKNIYLWDITLGKIVRTLAGSTGEVSEVVFSPDGKFIYSGGNDNLLRIWDVSTGNEMKEFNIPTKRVNTISFSSDSKSIVIGCAENSLRIMDISTGKVRLLTGYYNPVKSISVSPDGRYIADASGKIITIWDLAKGNVLRVLDGHTNNVIAISFSPDGKYLLSGGYDKTLRIWDFLNGKELKKIKGDMVDVLTVGFSPEGNKIFCGGSDQIIRLWDAKSGDVIRTLTGQTGWVVSGCFSPDGKYLAGGSNWQNEFLLWNVMSGSIAKTFLGYYGGVNSLCFSHDGRYIASGNVQNNIVIWDVESGRELKQLIGHTHQVNAVSFSPDGKYLASASGDFTIKLWDVSTAKELKTFIGHGNEVNSVCFSPDGNYVFSGSSDGTIKRWNITTGDCISFLSSENSEWIIYTSDNYWDGSNSCGDLVSMVKGLNCWNIDQFAVLNNRPDIILKRLKSDNNEMITHFENQYKKRLHKLGISEIGLTQETHVPNAIITKCETNGKNVTINATLSDSRYNLKNYNIFINNVPLYGAYGKTCTGLTLEISERIDLIKGENKIEISCINEKGSESYRALAYANYSSDAKGNLYFLAFGVSKYANPVYNLQFADKDALDLAKVIETYKGKGFENVYTKVLANEQVTPDAIKASKDFVKNAKPDDTFILFIAGHGMHDSDPEATYYYLTSNADINNLKGTAADFETIEDLLQGIPPRNKLFLMDACESGEIDDEEQGHMIATATGVGISSRGFKNTSSQTTNNEQRTTKRSYLYQKDRYIYNDLVRRSGAIVFSSSKGGEFSYERSDIQNGLFTYWVMKALTTTEADKDGNGIVSTDELREYVSAQVAKASGDLQHPTVDRDNIYQKFGFSLR